MSCACRGPSSSCDCHKPSPLGYPAMRAGGYSLQGDPMRVMRAGASDPFGAFLCAITPGGVKDLVRHWIDDNAKLWNDPAIGWLIGPWPYLLADVLETCNIEDAGRRAACRLQNNCAMTLAVAPVATGLAVASVIGAPLAIVLPIVGACAAAMLPVCKSLCAGHAPNWNDVMAMAGAVVGAGGALLNGDNKAAMAQLGGLVATAAEIGGEPQAAVIAADKKLTGQRAVPMVNGKPVVYTQLAALKLSPAAKNNTIGALIKAHAAEVKAAAKEAARLRAKDVQARAVHAQAEARAAKEAAQASAARIQQMTANVQALGQVGSLALPQLIQMEPVRPQTTNVPGPVLPIGATGTVVIPSAAATTSLAPALIGAGAGFAIGGPIGAAIGAGAGFVFGKAK